MRRSFTMFLIKKLITNILDNEEKTLLFAIYNSQNQRSYLTVKLK